MPTILHNLPFFDDETTLEVQGQTCRVLPLQIIVWVSLTVRGIRQLDKRALRFPAVLDTGFTDSFLIHPSHLLHFAGFRPEQLRRGYDSLRSHGRIIPLHEANLWLHPNKSTERDTASGSPPVMLEADRGIAIPTDREIYPAFLC